MSDTELMPEDLDSTDHNVDMSTDSLRFDPSSRLTLDRSCHHTHDFDEILEASHQDDLSCLYCADYVSTDEDQFKNHLLRVHFTFSYSFMIDDHKECVLACRRNCITRPKQGNRSHFHCPACGRTYGRKPALAHHIEVWKGRCIPIVSPPCAAPSDRRLKRQHLRNKIQHGEVSKRRFTLDSAQAASFLDSQLRNNNTNGLELPYAVPNSSYTVVVENEDSSMTEENLLVSQPKMERLAEAVIPEQLPPQEMSPSRATGTSSFGRIFSKSIGNRQEDDAAWYFGKTVTSRIRGLSAKKQAEAMQKIMQILFEVEYAGSS